MASDVVQEDINIDKREMKIAYSMSLIVLAFVSCIHSANLGSSKIGDLEIHKYSHYSFHYLEIDNKKKALHLLYPVGDENLEFTGGYGPIFQISKRNKKDNTYSYLITNSKTDSVCFLNCCFIKRGTHTDIDEYDKILFRKIDSFCKENYSFYKRDIKEFKYWYLPFRR